MQAQTKQQIKFEVEWCSDLGAQELDNFNPDILVFSFRDFSKKSDANKFAKSILATAKMGDVRIQKFYLEPDPYSVSGFDRIYVGETELWSI